MKNWVRGLLAASVLALASGSAEASSMSISPVSIEIAAPGAASRITLVNDGTESINAQIRVFKWIQKNGKDELVPTRDVVASPPAIKIEPGKKTVIRVVRINKQPVAVEETYRMLVSEVPKPLKASSGVSLAIQYSVPVFFVSQRGREQLSWNARLSKGRLLIEAANEGTRRAKLVNLQVSIPGMKTATLAEGLAGYVLPNSRKIWAAKSNAFKPGTKITITAKTEQGPVNATALVAGQ